MGDKCAVRFCGWPFRRGSSKIEVAAADVVMRRVAISTVEHTFAMARLCKKFLILVGKAHDLWWVGMWQGEMRSVIVYRFRKGEDVLESLNQLVRENHVLCGSFTAIGNLEKAEVGFFADRRYSTISCKGPLEVCSCIGNVASKEGVPVVHAHISLADKEGRMYGGHLMPGCLVDVTFEVVLHSYKGLVLERKFDSATKLDLLQS